jgi:hypothetical protein
MMRGASRHRASSTERFIAALAALDYVPVLFLGPGPMSRETLANYPFVTVRIACRNCRRRGSYRLARLAERFGADATLDDVLTIITANCNLAANRTGRRGYRAAYFADIEPTRTPEPPPQPSLRVILGGRHPASEE